MTNTPICPDCTAWLVWILCEYCERDGFCLVCNGIKGYWFCLNAVCPSKAVAR